MTIVCMKCKTVMGEKCGKCGSLDVERKMTLRGKVFYECQAFETTEMRVRNGGRISVRVQCGYFWTPSSGPETTSICDACAGDKDEFTQTETHGAR